jgi:hypothetical protein
MMPSMEAGRRKTRSRRRTYFPWQADKQLKGAQMRKRILALTAAGILGAGAALGVAACGGDDNGNSTTGAAGAANTSNGAVSTPNAGATTTDNSGGGGGYGY